MLNVIVFAATFLQPSVKLENGRSVKIIGKGPPVVFSTGLYGTMPRQLYNTVINGAKKKVSIVVFEDSSPIMKDDVENAADAIGVNKVGFFSHSAIDLGILKSDRVEKALLYDPITTPQLSILGVDTQEVDTEIDVTIVNAENTVRGKVPLPNFNVPKINGNCNYITDTNVGHGDILDPMWSNFVRRFPLWNSNVKRSQFSDYKDWVFTTKKVDDTSEYRQSVIDRICSTFSVKKEEATTPIITPTKESYDSDFYEKETPGDYE